MKEKKKRLLIAPHPDDDLIGCGGSIAKGLREGDEVRVIYVTNGDAKNTDYDTDEFALLRQKETQKAAEVIGLKEMNFLNKPVWGINQEELREEILKLIRRLKPDICYIPHKNDAHLDHRIVHQAALDAISMASGPWFKEYGEQEDSWEVSVILCYEVWTPLTEISYVEDVTDFIEVKTTALLEHKSQIANKKYDEAVKGLNRYRGIMTGKGDYCECFKVMQITNI